ncbi:hypothetical protein EDD76_11068 [Kineothrix alysoides]|uniref:Uncharacterized protein n=1 Tax=Kineothrix alysoides TaxID=1469948 RepID=A0A4R1QSL9_9FIRM|nr:hypothetical protein EDD76_11068 [Kineothrix alysoides]
MQRGEGRLRAGGYGNGGVVGRWELVEVDGRRVGLS